MANPQQISIVITASPSPSNPSTFLIEKCLESIAVCLPCLARKDVPVVVVLDGYVVTQKAQTKRGRISQDMVEPYSKYHEAIIAMCERLGLLNYRVERLPTHHGFALAVKTGLELCTTTYCLVCQYDRVFRRKFTRVDDVVRVMEAYEHVRYVGFPTANSRSHALQLDSRYDLTCLTAPGARINLDVPDARTDSGAPDARTDPGVPGARDALIDPEDPDARTDPGVPGARSDLDTGGAGAGVSGGRGAGGGGGPDGGGGVPGGGGGGSSGGVGVGSSGGGAPGAGGSGACEGGQDGAGSANGPGDASTSRGGPRPAAAAATGADEGGARGRPHGGGHGSGAVRSQRSGGSDGAAAADASAAAEPPSSDARAYVLQPCIFWYDSQHLCHRTRYLSIFTPFATMGAKLLATLGTRFVKDMVLRPGDFIEDRFGQMQRRCFIEMRARGLESPEIIAAFRWFGSYLVWTEVTPADAGHADFGVDVYSDAAFAGVAGADGGGGGAQRLGEGGGDGDACGCSGSSSEGEAGGAGAGGVGAGGGEPGSGRGGSGGVGSAAGAQQGQQSSHASPSVQPTVWPASLDHHHVHAPCAMADANLMPAACIGARPRPNGPLPTRRLDETLALVYVSHLRGRHIDFAKRAKYRGITRAEVPGVVASGETAPLPQQQLEHDDA
ncbi:hypothetical protein FOA52_006704 [Chlamydomonas sp. UWO 241]|nr:hypothetical protein FOA52_006704 [Chlamydomonas sp. UWO 241]